MDRKRRDARHSRRNFLKTAAGVSAGAMLMRDPLWAQNAPGGKAAASASLKIHQPYMITPKQALDWHVFKAECGPDLRRQHGLEALHRLPDLEDAGVRRRRSRLRRNPVRPLHRRGLAGSADAHARLAERGRETRHRRNAGAGRRVVRDDVGLDAARRHHGADALLRSGASAGGVANRRQDPGLPDAEAAGAAVQQQLPRQLHAHRLRVALARQVAASCSRRRRSRTARRFTAGGCGVS